MNDKRPSTEPPSERQLSRQLGISRAALWRAKKVAEIPEDEFEALIERDNPATVTQLVACSHNEPRLRPAHFGEHGMRQLRSSVQIFCLG